MTDHLWHITEMFMVNNLRSSSTPMAYSAKKLISHVNSFIKASTYACGDEIHHVNKSTM